MRYMFIVKSDEKVDRSGPPPKALMDAIGQLMVEAGKQGKLVSTGGLRHSADGARVRLDGGKVTVIDGPFSEAKEVIGGFAIMELPSKEAAIEEARVFMELHRQHWPEWQGESELRLMYAEGETP